MMMRFVNWKIHHDAAFPVKPLEVSRNAIVYGPDVHMEIGIPGRKNTTMMPRVKADYFHRLVGDGKVKFGFCVPFGIVCSTAPIPEDVEGRLGGKTIQSEHK